MDVAEFMDYRKHIDYVVDTFGQWVGVCDEEGWPLLELPPTISLSASETRGASSSVEATVRLDAGHPLLQEFIGKGLGEMKGGKLELAGSAARLLVVQRPGARLAYQATIGVASGVSGPSELNIRGVDLLEGLSAWPCPSIPLEWTKAKFSSWNTDASGAEYSKPRELARVEFGTAVDGYTVDGPAVSVLRTLIQDSLDAVNALCGWSDDPHMVVDFSGVGVDTSPRVLVRTSDDVVWDTIADVAQSAGVTVLVDLWWPGDDPVQVRQGRDPARYRAVDLGKPMQVVRVEVTE